MGRDIGELAATRMIDGPHVSGAAACTLENRQRPDGLERRLGGHPREVLLMPVDEQHRTMQRGDPRPVVPLCTGVEHTNRVDTWIRWSG